MEKQELIEEIKKLLATSEDDVTEINPAFVEYFELDELKQIKEKLIFKKSKIRETTFEYLDEIYEKTKEN